MKSGRGFGRSVHLLVALVALAGCRQQPPKAAATEAKAQMSAPAHTPAVKAAEAKAPIAPQVSSHKISIPSGPEAKTAKDFEKIKLDWSLRHSVESYQKAGKRNPAWDGAAIEFLKGSCLRARNWEDAPSTQTLLQQGKDLLAAGCDDPVVLRWCYWLYPEGQSVEISEPLIRRAIEGLAQGQYAKINSYFAKMNLASCLNAQGKRSEAYALRQQVLDSLVQSIQEGDFRDGEQFIAYRLVDGWPSFLFGEERWPMMADALRDTKTSDPYFEILFRGETELKEAWDARGGGWAREVTKEGWKGFGEHLGKAHDLFAKAWQLHPEQPEAAAKLIGVTMGGAGSSTETLQLWFNRAVAAQMDYGEAYTSLLWAIRPRWGGSHAEMLQLGEAALATGRFDTYVPLFYLRTLRDVGEEIPGNQWRTLFRDARCQENLQKLFDGLLKEPCRVSDRPHLLTLRAMTEMWAGQYDQAKQDLAQAGVRVNLRNGYWGQSISWEYQKWKEVDGELAAFTGPCKEILTKAESLELEGKTPDALQLYQQALAQSEADRSAYGFVLDRIAMINIEHKKDVGFARMPGGAFRTAIYMGDSDVVNFLLDHGVSLDAPLAGGETPFQLAVDDDSREVAALLISRGAKTDVRDSKGNTPLARAASGGMQQVVWLLLSKDVQVDEANQDGYTPLILAASRGHRDIMKMLLDRSANPNLANRYGGTALSTVIDQNDLDGARLLLDHGADPNKAATWGWTPLRLAVKQANPVMVQLLLEKGADPEKADRSATPPLVYACHLQDPACALALLEHGAKPNGKGEDAWSPLHLAAHYGQIELAKALLAKGADRNAALKDGSTPLKIAQNAKQEKIVELLSK